MAKHPNNSANRPGFGPGGLTCTPSTVDDPVGRCGQRSETTKTSVERSELVLSPTPKAFRLSKRGCRWQGGCTAVGASINAGCRADAKEWGPEGSADGPAGEWRTTSRSARNTSAPLPPLGTPLWCRCRGHSCGVGRGARRPPAVDWCEQQPDQGRLPGSTSPRGTELFALRPFRFTLTSDTGVRDPLFVFRSVVVRRRPRRVRRITVEQSFKERDICQQISTYANNNAICSALSRVLGRLRQGHYGIQVVQVRVVDREAGRSDVGDEVGDPGGAWQGDDCLA